MFFDYARRVFLNTFIRNIIMSIIKLLKKYNIEPKKGLGQNFLIAEPTVKKIVDILNINKNDKVLEIGPGPGTMTNLILEKAKFVAAIETDKNMIRILEEEYGHIENLHIIHGNILDSNLEKLLSPDKGKWVFIGNIPYNITSPILFHLRKFRHCFSRGLLMVQKEVAIRMTASKGTKDYGILSIAIQAVAEVKKCFNVSASSFQPEPKVDSTVVSIDFDKASNYNIDDLDFFTRVVRAAFSTRRKTIKNALLQSNMIDIGLREIETALKTTGIKESARAEQLDIQTFAKLVKVMRQVSKL